MSSTGDKTSHSYVNEVRCISIFSSEHPLIFHIMKVQVVAKERFCFTLSTPFMETM
jgi:hypothetical protein